MGRFIAFDRLTASELSRHTKRAPQLGHGDPLKAALGSDAPALLLLDSEREGEVVKVEIRRLQSVAPAPMPQPVRQAAPPARQAAQPSTEASAPRETPTQHAMPPAARAHADAEPESAAYGFLGLSDTPMLSEEADAAEKAPEKKKRWWKR